MLKLLCRIVTVICTFAATAAHTETLTLGSVNDNVRKHVLRFTPLAAYLEDALREHGVTSVEILVLPSSDAMARALSEGRVDLFFDSPLVAAKVARQVGAIPFLRRWKRGVAEYHSVILVPDASPIQSLGDLTGRKIGFQEPDSTSGFLLPAGMISREGLRLTRLNDRSELPPGDALGYVFTGDDENTVLWLARGWIDAGATDPRGFEILEAARPGEYRALARSIDVPRQVVVRRAEMDPALSDIVAHTLIGMAETPEGLEVMQQFHETSQFDQFPDGVPATFAPIYDLLDELRALGIEY